MNEPASAPKGDDEPGLYEIRIKGYLADRWATEFEGLTITREASGNTCLTGSVVDQAALYGLLRKVRDLGLFLLSLNCVDPDQGGTFTEKPQNLI